MKLEKKFETRVRRFLEQHGCETEKLHGNEFQSGLPDVLIGRSDGYVILIEFKWTRARSLTLRELWGMLRPSQKSFFHRWKEFPVYVCVGSGQGCALFLAEQLKKGGLIEWEKMEDVFENLLGL